MSGRAVAVGAQAKVNLFLHVLEREVSGYHQIETLFCRLALADDITVRVPDAGSARSIDCTGAETGRPEENLGYRAAQLYSERRGWPSGFAVEITKRIPVGGGLGGGSADAGAVLRALRVLDPNPPHPAELQHWAARLGADVPMMTLESPLALGWGRGERLLPLPALPSRAVALYVPPFRVPTPAAYQWLDEARAASPGDGPQGRSGYARPASARSLDLHTLSDWRCVAPLISNDFEGVVGQRHPEISSMVARFRGRPDAVAALMSGSGSTVFCVLSASPSPRDAITAPDVGQIVMTETAEYVVEVRRID